MIAQPTTAKIKVLVTTQEYCDAVEAMKRVVQPKYHDALDQLKRDLQLIETPNFISRLQETVHAHFNRIADGKKFCAAGECGKMIWKFTSARNSLPMWFSVQAVIHFADCTRPEKFRKKRRNVRNPTSH